jgi:ribosomal-protein-serine acetyltransferase
VIIRRRGIVLVNYQLDNDTYLKLLTYEDSEELFTLTNSCRKYLRKWLPWVDFTTSVEDSNSFIQLAMSKSSTNNGFETGIWYKEKFAGVIGFHSVDWSNKKTTIGYWLGEPFQGNGIMTKACAAYVNYAFNELNLNRVEIRCAVENSKSRAIPERLGFTNEGTAREAEWLSDHFVDHIVYGLLVRDWKDTQL